MRRTIELPETINVRVSRNMREALTNEAARAKADISDVVRSAIAAAITGDAERQTGTASSDPT